MEAKGLVWQWTWYKEKNIEDLFFEGTWGKRGAPQGQIDGITTNELYSKAQV